MGLLSQLSSLFGSRSSADAACGGGNKVAPSEHSAVVYTRQGCHLCDEAIEILVRHGLTPTKIDIDADPELRGKYTSCVPVVEIDGKIRFRAKVNEVLLKRILAAEAAPP